MAYESVTFYPKWYLVCVRFYPLTLIAENHSEVNLEENPALNLNTNLRFRESFLELKPDLKHY